MQMVALVTGASKGIGKKIAIDLADNGIKVIANYNKSEREAIKIKEENKNIDIYKADLTKNKEINQMIEYTIKKYGKIDILINNAGISKKKLITDVTDDEFKEIINTNLYSAFATSREVSKNMIYNKQGCIINISSIWGNVGASMEVVYSISKAGINGLTKSLAKELGPSNIRVNAIAPGIIETNMNNDLSTKELESIVDDIPLQKIGKTSNISKCIKWLIEDDYTTGQIITIDGGWYIS